MLTVWSNIFMGVLIFDSLFTPNPCVGSLVPRAVLVGTGERKMNREGLVGGCQATRGMYSKRIQFFLMGSWVFLQWIVTETSICLHQVCLVM